MNRWIRNYRTYISTTNDIVSIFIFGRLETWNRVSSRKQKPVRNKLCTQNRTTLDVVFPDKSTYFLFSQKKKINHSFRIFFFINLFSISSNRGHCVYNFLEQTNTRPFIGTIADPYDQLGHFPHRTNRLKWKQSAVRVRKLRVWGGGGKSWLNK